MNNNLESSDEMIIFNNNSHNAIMLSANNAIFNQYSITNYV